MGGGELIYVSYIKQLLIYGSHKTSMFRDCRSPVERTPDKFTSYTRGRREKKQTRRALPLLTWSAVRTSWSTTIILGGLPAHCTSQQYAALLARVPTVLSAVVVSQRMGAIDIAQARRSHHRFISHILTFGEMSACERKTVGEVLTLMQKQDLKIDVVMNCVSDHLILSRLNERIVHTTEAQTDISASRIGFMNLCYLERNS